MERTLAGKSGLRIACGGVLALGLAAAGAEAQAPRAKPAAPATHAVAPTRGFGVNETADGLWGGGPDYKVRFGSDEVEFTPALGSLAEHDLPLAFSTVSVGRGSEQRMVAAGNGRRAGATVVEYDRAPGLVERHEVGEQGLELSYEFATQPAGTGDLVVRLRLRSELPMEANDAGLRCVRPGVGGVRWGAVTGVDAQGRSAPGAMRLDGDLLELSLPAAFVDTAAFPVVLDPLVYPVAFVALDPGHDEDRPDVAYEANGNVYLVVWTKKYSNDDYDIRGQFLDASGAVIFGSHWLIETASNTVAMYASAASVHVTSRFMVVWHERPSASGPTRIRGCSISAVGFGMSSAIDISQGAPGSHQFPNVGGHSSTQTEIVPVVWGVYLAPDGSIRQRSLHVPYQGDPYPATSDVVLADDVGFWCISPSGGDLRRYLVVFSKNIGADLILHGLMIDELGNVLYGPAPLGAAGTNCLFARTDGDGQVFFTVYDEFDDPQSAHAVRTVFNGTSFTSTDIVIDQHPLLPSNSPGLTPNVAYTGNGALVAWTKLYAGEDTDIALVGLDPWTGAVADPLAYADFNSDTATWAVLCARYSASHVVGDGALCAWEVSDSLDDLADTDILAAAVDPELGVVVDLGGATALGGKASVSAATVGNAGFTHFYDGLYGFNSVTLLVGVSGLFAPFCTGTLVPDPLFVLPLGTKADSTLVLPTPLPPDPLLLGLTLYEQYAESDPFTPPCGKNIQLSNGLSITIE